MHSVTPGPSDRPASEPQHQVQALPVTARSRTERATRCRRWTCGRSPARSLAGLRVPPVPPRFNGRSYVNPPPGFFKTLGFSAVAPRSQLAGSGAVTGMAGIDWLLKRVGKAAAEAAPAVRRVPPPLPPPPRRVVPVRMPPPPPPRVAVAAPRAADVVRFPEVDDYLSEWNRLMDAGVPNEYRMYGVGAERLKGNDEVRSVFEALIPEARGKGYDAANYLAGRPHIQTGPVYGPRGVEKYFGVAQKKINRAGDLEHRLQVYGRDGTNRHGGILYSVPLEEAEKLRLAEKLRALGYEEYIPGQ
jgi:hypothetical protein